MRPHWGSQVSDVAQGPLVFNLEEFCGISLDKSFDIEQKNVNYTDTQLLHP